MKFNPHPYQAYATQRILDLPAVGLFLDMGLGKTAAALTAVSELMHNRFDVNRTLVIAPLRVAEDTWTREAAKWDHLKYLRFAKVLGTPEKRRKALAQRADIYLINRENVEWLVNEYKDAWPFDMVIIDELSSFKSSSAKRFKALRRVRPLIRRMVGLTGTPVPNGLLDLWPQIYLLDRGMRLGRTMKSYRDEYFLPGRRNQAVVFDWIPRPGAGAIIEQKIADICVSMTGADWAKLPPRIDRTILVTLPPQARKAYNQMEKDRLLPGGDWEVVSGEAATLAGKLLQMANGAVYDDTHTAHRIHDAKLDALEDLVEQANGKPVLVFYAYQHDLAGILERLPKTARKLQTTEDIDAWNAGNIPVLVAHPAGAGHGLNLQDGGCTVIWYGLTYSLELYQQANARIHRQGQQHTVIVHHIIAENTLDTQILRILAGKAEGQSALLEALKARRDEVMTCREN